MSEWYTIDSAPKDGTRVLLFCDGQQFIGQWSEHAAFGFGRENSPGWQIFDCEGDEWYSIAIESPSHWQHLQPDPV